MRVSLNAALRVVQKYKSQSRAPLLINSCEVDPAYDLDKQAIGDKVFAGFAPGYQRTHWEGCTHGFAVRGDMVRPRMVDICASY